MNILYLILGWLLGLLSPQIVDKIKQYYTKQELFNGIKTEIKETQYRLICTAHILGMRAGKCDREYLEWCLPYFENYEGNQPTENIKKAIKDLLNKKNEDIDQAVLILRKKDEGIGLSLKEHHLPFLESKFSNISMFNIELQNILHEINTRIRLLNEETEKAIKYFFMTFDTNQSEENHKLIKNNIYDAYKNLQIMAISIIKEMDKIINYNKKI
ncbi:MAG: hypothetical protein HZB54_06875 [Deltaproteobacteria bacterium]|nr:hypothetical protein [Deltaproteobacteria bacterium]